MKFAIAAGIIAQVLPVASEDSARLLPNAKHAKLLQLQTALLQDSGHHDPGQPSHRFQAIKLARKKKRRQHFPSGELKNDPGVVVPGSIPDLTSFELEYCDPVSDDPDVGVLSCGTGRLCRPSQKSLLGGVCASGVTNKSKNRRGNPDKEAGKKKKPFKKALKNRGPDLPTEHHESPASITLCDPAADIGALSMCGADATCMKNAKSKFGGICTSSATPTSRALQSLSNCDPASLSFEENCDCSGLDLASGSGTIVCPSYDGVECLNSRSDPRGCTDTCCYETCGSTSFESTFLNDDFISGKICYIMTNPAYAQEFCLGVDRSSDPRTCYAEFDGQACLCEVEEIDYAYVFDCTAVGGSTGRDIGGIEPFNTMPIVSTCYTECEVCPGSFYSFVPYSNLNIAVDLPGFPNATCSDLESMMLSGQDQCLDVTSIAQESCCVYRCRAVCDYIGMSSLYAEVGITIPGIGETTCGALDDAVYTDLSIPEESCAAAYETAQANCCGQECAICPSKSYFSIDAYDIPVTIPGYPGISTCGDLYNAVYTDLSIPEESCAAASETAQANCCGQICAICPSNSFFSNDAYDIPVTIPGYPGISTCGDLYNAAYDSLEILPDSCPAVTESGQDACCILTCDICPTYGSYIDYELFDVLAGDGLTCYDISNAAYFDRIITEEACPAYTELAQTSCCSAPICHICDYDEFIPYANYNITVGDGITCSDIEYAVYSDARSVTGESTTCVAYQELGKPCCSEYSYGNLTPVPGSGSTSPSGAPEFDSNTTMSPTSTNPATSDPPTTIDVVPITSAPSAAPPSPDGAIGSLSKNAVASLFGASTALVIFLLR